MAREFSMEAVGGMFDDLKSRLGFSHDEERYAPGEYDGYADEDFDFEEYSDFDASPAVGGFVPAQPYSPRTSRFGKPDSSPNLVSIGDVKAQAHSSEHTIPDTRSRTTGSYAATSTVGGHTVIDATAPVPASPAYKAAVRDGVVRDEGALGAAAAAASVPAAAYGANAASRQLMVIRPVAYGDAERIAPTLRAGGVVVLAMRTTPTELYRRVLDFSFGVASALEASVESPAEKVFAIACGNALTDDEKRRLRAQSVL